jgi:uncharacterized protein (DUF305 family)
MNRYPLLTILTVCWLATPVYADNTATKHNAHEMSHEHKQMQSSPNAQSAAYDHQFIDTMMAHHQMAMHMSEMAEPKVTHPELKDKIRMMMDEQKKEIEEFQSLKQKHYGDKGDALNMKMPGMMSMGSMDMKALESAQGADFDKKFIDMMIKHHKGGITMAESELKKGKQSDVKEMASKIIKNQKRDIDEMSRMKKELGQKA